jgi:hypothetical protein
VHAYRIHLRVTTHKLGTPALDHCFSTHTILRTGKISGQMLSEDKLCTAYVQIYIKFLNRIHLLIRIVFVFIRLYHQPSLSSSSSSSSPPTSSLARQSYVGPGLPQKLLPAEVPGYCFFRFRDKSLFQGGGFSPTPNPRLSCRADVFRQGRLS